LHITALLHIFNKRKRDNLDKSNNEILKAKKRIFIIKEEKYNSNKLKWYKVTKTSKEFIKQEREVTTTIIKLMFK
jgi:hypothetical protein